MFSTGLCRCDSGYVQTSSSEPCRGVTCGSISCYNGGSCVGGACVCETGWQGTQCTDGKFPTCRFDC